MNAAKSAPSCEEEYVRCYPRLVQRSWKEIWWSYHPDASREAEDYDTEWFARYPSRNYRLRVAIEMEAPDMGCLSGGEYWAVVRRNPADGLAYRKIFPMWENVEPHNSERNAERIWNLAYVGPDGGRYRNWRPQQK
jgi:hypothetical protein